MEKLAKAREEGNYHYLIDRTDCESLINYVRKVGYLFS